MEVYTSEELAARIVASWLPEASLVYWTFNGYSTYISKYGDNRWRWSAGHADGFDDNGYEGSLSEAAMAIAKIVTGEEVGRH